MVKSKDEHTSKDVENINLRSQRTCKNNYTIIWRMLSHEQALVDVVVNGQLRGLRPTFLVRIHPVALIICNTNNFLIFCLIFMWGIVLAENKYYLHLFPFY